MSDIPRIRYNQIRLKKLFGEKTGSTTSEPDVSHLPFRRSSHEELTFDEGRIKYNGVDVWELIDDQKEGKKVDIALCAGLAGAVDEYRRQVWSRYGTDKRDFNGQVQAVLEKLMNKLGQAYDEVSGGMRVQLLQGKLWINDIDPKVVLALFLSNPNEERRRYLQSIQTKLALILEGKAGKASSNGVVEEAKRIYRQICEALENSPSTHPTPLLAAVGHLGR